MLTLVIGGQRALLALLRPYLATLQIGLFTNDWRPAIPDTIAAVQEATYTGYARQSITSWSAVFTNLAGQAEVDAPAYTFQVTAPSSAQYVYGYFVADNLGNLIWGERNPAGPQPMFGLGAPYVVVPRFVLTNFFLSAYAWNSEGGGLGGGSASS